MQEYEYIVLGHDKRPLLVVPQAHLNDSTAIKSAMSFVRGLEFEVWRDVDCIHSASESFHISASQPEGSRIGALMTKHAIQSC